MYLCKTKPKHQAIRIEAKKEGSDIPKTEKNKIDLSIQLSLNIAEKIPKTIPKDKAISIAENARKKVALIQ